MNPATVPELPCLQALMAIADTLDPAWGPDADTLPYSLALEKLIDLDIRRAVSATLRSQVAIYLDCLPGFLNGDFGRASDQHRLRLELLAGEAQLLTDGEVEAFGLEGEDET